MAKNSLDIKLWLINQAKKVRRIPLFVVAKTGRKITRNKHTRNWRRDQLLTRNVRKAKKKAKK